MRVIWRMRGGDPDFAAAVDTSFPDDSAALAATPMRHPSALMAYNVLRFVSVLVGAGLLLRAGASEQAISAISYEAHPREQATKPRIVLPPPALRMVAKTNAASFDDENGRSARGGSEEPRQRIAPLKPVHRTVPSDKAAPPSPAKFAPVARIADASPPAGSSRLASATFSLARRRPEAALLAPVKVASRPQVVTVTGPPAFLAGRVSADLTGSARKLPGAKLQATPGQVAAEPASSLVPRTPTIASPTNSADSVPAGNPQLKLSLAAPEMTPGPRTTVLTSDIQDVMHRPASAWDYADALPGEVTGYGAPGQRKAEVEPIPVPQPVPERFAASTPRPVVAGPVASNHPAADHATVARASSASRSTAASETQVPVQNSPSRPLALLDVAPRVNLQALAAKADRRSASIAPGSSRDDPAQAPAPEAAKAVLLAADKASRWARFDPAQPRSRRDSLGIAPPADSSAAASSVVAAASNDVPFGGGAASAMDDSGAASVSAVEAHGTRQSGTSLRDSIPRPAF